MIIFIVIILNLSIVMELHLCLVTVITFILLQPEVVLGHGRLVEPASRNAMWRFKYNNPRNYNDMGLNCGGFTVGFVWKSH